MMALPPASDIWWPRLQTCSKLFTCGPPPRPPVLRCGSTYGQNVGGMHPTGLLSCT